jgi:hypothetical protein
MPYQFYKLIHFLGIFLTLTALAITAAHVVRGGTRTDNPLKKLAGALHGIGLLLVLTGGFGMLARLGLVQVHMFPGWIIAKMVIWLMAGAALMMPYRSKALAWPVLVGAPLLFVAAAYFALYKPF